MPFVSNKYKFDMKICCVHGCISKIKCNFAHKNISDEEIRPEEICHPGGSVSRRDTVLVLLLLFLADACFQAMSGLCMWTATTTLTPCM